MKFMHPRIRTLIFVLAGAGFVWWFVSGINIATVSDILRHANPWPLIGALILINLTMVIRGLRWKAILGPIATVSLRNTLAATAIGFGAIFVFGRTGEIIRPAVLSLRERLRPSVTVATLFIERVLDTAAVVLLFSVNLIFFEPRGPAAARTAEIAGIRNLGALLTAGVIVAIALLVCLRLRAAPVILFIEERLIPLAPKVIRPIANFVHHLTDGLSVLTNRAALALIILHTIAVWGMVAFSSWLVPKAFGCHLTLSESVFLLGMGLVGSLIPTPGGGAGAYHAVAASGLQFLGVEHNIAASVAIAGHLIGFGTPSLMAACYLVRDGLQLSRIRELIASETSNHPLPGPMEINPLPPGGRPQ